MHNFIKKGKKALTIGVTLATIVWSIGIFGMPLAFAASSGDLIKITCTGTNGSVCTAVYYLGADGKRYVFPNEKAYMTWYSDFSGVMSISQSEMESYPIGGNVTYRPGVKMVKIQTDPKVYAVSKGGVLRHVATEAVATSLYGANWNTMIDDVPDPFFVNYTIGAQITSSGEYDKAAQMAGSTTINEDKGLAAGVSSGSTLTVALSPDTPASNLLIGGASRVKMTTVTLSASADGDITVDQLVIQRDGAAQDGAFSSFDILDASTMLPINNTSKTLNSQHQATFGDDFVVRAGTSMKVILAANMTAGALVSYAGEVPVLSLFSLTLKHGATVVGVLPISGNYHTVNGTLTVGAAAITVGTSNPAATTKEVGTKNYIVSSIKLTNNSTITNQNLRVTSVTFTQNGSATVATDLENIRLQNTNTGQFVGGTPIIKGDEVSFVGMDIIVDKGNSVNFDLWVDIKSGSARNISLDIEDNTDVAVFDLLRGYNVTPTYTNSAAATVSATPYYNANDTHIGNGKLRIESLAITENKIPENTNKVKIGRFKFVVEGEQVNITAIGLKITTSGTNSGKTSNLQLVNSSGVTVGGPVDATVLTAAPTQATATTTDTISVPVGEHIFEVYGDLDTGFSANDTIQVGIFPQAITVKGDVSGNTITPTPAGQIQSTVMTVKPAALAVSLDSVPAAQTVVAGTQDFEVARFVLDASNSGSDVRVTQFAIVVVDTNAMPNILTGIEIFDGGTKVPVSSESQSCSGASCSTLNTQATTTFTISVGNLTVPKNTTKVLSVRGDIGTATTTGSFLIKLGGSNITAVDSEAQTVTPTYTTGNGASFTMSSGGTLQIANATDPKSAQVVAGSTVEVGRFIAKAKNEAITLNQFGFTVAAPDGGVVGNQDELNSLELWELGGSSALGTITVNAANATITPTTALTLPLNAERTYIVKAKLATISDSTAASSGSGFKINLSHVDVDGTSPGSSSVTLSGHNTAFNTFSVFKSVPTVTQIGFTGSDKITGNSTVVDLYKLSVKADSAGPVGLFKLTFGVSTTTVGLTTTGYYLYESDSSSTLGDVLSNTGDFNVTLVGGTAPQAIVEARFDVNNDDSANHAEADVGDHLVIDAGTTKYLTLRGTTDTNHDGTADNESISTVLAGDPAFAGTGQENVAAIDGTDAADDFIWSDLSFDLYTSSTATITAGWFNGYRVKGMDDTSSTPQVVTD